MLRQTIILGLGALLAATVAQAAITTDVLGKDSRECVTYARSRVPSLPYGLWTWDDKKRIKNSSSCKAGSVAIIDVGNNVGHVAVVENCDSSGSSQSITITETNFKRGYLTRRISKTSKISKSQAELKIYGYYRP